MNRVWLERPTQRQGQLRIQRVIPIDSPRFIPRERLQEPHSWTKEFGRTAPLALEIGCGTGHFILDRAKQQPENDFLAIDIYNKGCLKTCRKLDADDLGNVRVLRIEARELLVNFIRPAGLQAIYINCPDPWPKLRHRERRLVNLNFLTLVLHRLAPDGDLYFSSDQRDYVEDVAASLSRFPAFRNQLLTAHAETLPGYPLSKYLRRFLDQGLPVHFIHVQRNPAVSLPHLSIPEMSSGFRSRHPAG